MAATIHVDLARAVDGSDLVEALTARGLAGELVEADERLSVRVSAADADAERLRSDVSRVLDAWCCERRLPLIPTALGEGGYVLRPPAG